MLNDEVGKDFRAHSRQGNRPRSGRAAIRVLIVDPVIGSRLVLADAVVRAGFEAVTASNSVDARIALERDEIGLVLADENTSGSARGLHFLIELRNQYRGIPRALLSQAEDPASMSQMVEQAGISFLLTKPLDVNALREALRGVLLGDREFGAWEQVDPWKSRALDLRGEPRLVAMKAPARPVKDFRHEMILRGILAGLNSIEFEDQLFPLVDLELAEAFQLQRWLCVDENNGRIRRIRGKRRVEGDAQSGAPSKEEQALLREAQSFDGVRQLVGENATHQDTSSHLVCLGFVLEEAGERALTCLVWCDSTCRATLLEMLRELRHGLNLTLRRIRDAQRRAEAAHQLAYRVSEELRNPVGALTHALDRMRGEAMRAGMSTESLDLVLSESHRVAQAMDHLEDEMWITRPSASPVSS